MCKLHSMLQLLDPLLSALARLLVARGVLFPDLAERLKAHYVAAASKAAGKVTDSRLSVMTGLQRRDVARLREHPPRAERTGHLTNLVTLWRDDPDYAGRALPRSGDAPSFDALARRIRQDVHPRTMLDALEAAGTVEVDAQDLVHLRQQSYQPLKGSDDQLTYLAHNVGDHIAAAADNVLGRTPPHFERAVHYTGLTTAQVAALRAAHHDGQMALFEVLVKQAAA